MRVLINHMTRMHHGRICVAGLSDDHRHVRPVSRTGDLLHRHLACEGGLFEVGAMIDLGYITPRPEAPHIEDVLFSPGRARRQRDVPAEQFWQRLQAVAKPTLRELFGPDLRPREYHHLAVDEGRGPCSLGCLRLQQPPRLTLEPRQGKDRIRLWLRSKTYEFDLGVTDLRLYAADHATPDRAAVERIAAKLANADYERGAVIVCVGLTRAHADWFSGKVPLHWLQVNNFHFADEPYWRLEQSRATNE
jgi:hypothetical protein